MALPPPGVGLRVPRRRVRPPTLIIPPRGQRGATEPPAIMDTRPSDSQRAISRSESTAILGEKGGGAGAAHHVPPAEWILTFSMKLASIR